MRFYFDAVGPHKTIQDEEGIEAGCLDEAVEQASAAISEMTSGGELDGTDGDWLLIIRDATGSVLKRLPIA